MIFTVQADFGAEALHKHHGDGRLYEYTCTERWGGVGGLVQIVINGVIKHSIWKTHIPPAKRGPHLAKGAQDWSVQ